MKIKLLLLFVFLLLTIKLEEDNNKKKVIDKVQIENICDYHTDYLVNDFPVNHLCYTNIKIFIPDFMEIYFGVKATCSKLITTVFNYKLKPKDVPLLFVRINRNTPVRFTTGFI
jgi:hypothetical protein